jgi:hypothetical protein
MSRGYIGLVIEEVILITPGCDLMAGEHVEEPFSAVRLQRFKGASAAGPHVEQCADCANRTMPNSSVSKHHFDIRPLH